MYYFAIRDSTSRILAYVLSQLKLPTMDLRTSVDLMVWTGDFLWSYRHFQHEAAALIYPYDCKLLV